MPGARCARCQESGGRPAERWRPTLCAPSMRGPRSRHAGRAPSGAETPDAALAAVSGACGCAPRADQGGPPRSEVPSEQRRDRAWAARPVGREALTPCLGEVRCGRGMARTFAEGRRGRPAYGARSPNTARSTAIPTQACNTSPSSAVPQPPHPPADTRMTDVGWRTVKRRCRSTRHQRVNAMTSSTCAVNRNWSTSTTWPSR
jgi:hypothetical protein